MKRSSGSTARGSSHFDSAREPIVTPARVARAAVLAAALTISLAVGGLSAACSRTDSAPVPAETRAVQTEPPAEQQASSVKPRIVFLGDSLTAGLGIAPDEAYPALIGRRLRASGFQYEVLNAGVSGDTSAAGLRRLEWSLKGPVEVLVVALGANDGLRGLPVTELQRNLATIIERARARHVAVLLAGMEAPPNFGAAYTEQFRAVYTALAKRYDVPLIPFFLEGVAGVPGLNQADGIHPNRAGHRATADLVWRQLEPMLTSKHTQ
jgi:acyl-CoA thioesterase-1